LTPEGKIDMDAVSTAFVAAVPEEWKASAKLATANCSAGLTQLYANSTAMPPLPPGVQMCKPCASFYTVCVQKNMLLVNSLKLKLTCLTADL